VRNGILLVEDYAELRDLVGEILRRAGYEVWKAANGAEGVALLRRNCGRLGLVLTDAAMPEMCGHTLAHQIRAGQIRGARADLKIILMTASHEAVLERNGLTLLRKPFTEDELIARVREALDDT
jgi:two-component system, OmpR family, response regulator VanR